MYVVYQDTKNKLDVGDELEARSDLYGPVGDNEESVLLHKAGKRYKVALSGVTSIAIMAETGNKNLIDRDGPYLANFVWHPFRPHRSEATSTSAGKRD